MPELLAEVNAALEAGRPCVYCAVVETRGSTPQKAGAAMLVFPDGGQVGTLGGGCVEAEVKQRALQALHGGGACGSADISPRRYPRMGRRPHLRRPHDHSPGPLARRDTRADYYRRLHTLTQQGRGFTEAVVVSDAEGLCAGDRYLFDADGVACNPESASGAAIGR